MEFWVCLMCLWSLPHLWAECMDKNAHISQVCPCVPSEYQAVGLTGTLLSVPLVCPLCADLMGYLLSCSVCPSVPKLLLVGNAVRQITRANSSSHVWCTSQNMGKRCLDWTWGFYGDWRTLCFRDLMCTESEKSLADCLVVRARGSLVGSGSR